MWTKQMISPVALAIVSILILAGCSRYADEAEPVGTSFEWQQRMQIELDAMQACEAEYTIVRGSYRCEGPERVEAARWETGRAAYQRGEYDVAYQTLVPLAKGGDARAQTLLGYMYANGRGVAVDYGEAAGWFSRAADRGDPAAQNAIGLLSYQGRGVAKDRAAAAQWFRRSAEQGNTEAQINLASLYQLGRGVPPDLVQAHFWYSLAAAQGSGSGRARRDEVAQLMSAAEIAEAKRLAEAWQSAASKP